MVRQQKHRPPVLLSQPRDIRTNYYMRRLLAYILFSFTIIGAVCQTDFRDISFDEARKAASREGKLVFMDFYTSWCGPCKRMTDQVFPQKSVGDYMNATFIPLKLDAEKGGSELAARYKVKSYPTYIVTDTAGHEIARLSCAMPAEEFLEKVRHAIDYGMTPERIKERFESGERTPQLVEAYAMQLVDKGEYRNINKIIDEYYHSLTDSQKLDPANTFVFTTFTMGFDNERTRYMIEHEEEFKKNNIKAINDRITQYHRFHK